MEAHGRTVGGFYNGALVIDEHALDLTTQRVPYPKEGGQSRFASCGVAGLWAVLVRNLDSENGVGASNIRAESLTGPRVP